MATRNLGKLSVALFVGAALALPAGFVLGRMGNRAEPPPRARVGDASVRDVFSPSVRSDPYFLARQREGVEALERHCQQTGQSCAEARAARVRLVELEGH